MEFHCMSQTLFTDTLIYLWIASAQFSCFIKWGVTKQWSSSGLEAIVILMHLLCYYKNVVGVRNVCIAEYAFMYPYNGGYLQVRSTLVKQKVCALTQSCKSTKISMTLTY